MKRVAVITLMLVAACMTIGCPNQPGIYTVTYDDNGSDGGAVPTDSNTYEAGDTVTVLGNTGELVKTGYVFGDWNTAADGSGTGYSADDTFSMGTADMILYAQWTQTDSEAPNEVTGLSALAGNGSAELSWTASDSSDVAGYKVYTRETGGSYDTAVDAGNVTTYQVTELTNGVFYTFKVTAYDAALNESTGVESASVLPLAAEAWDLKFHGGSSNDYATDVAVDPSTGFVYVVGYGTDLVGATGYDWWIKKFDPAGGEVTTGWNKQIHGGAGADCANAVAVSPDGSVYVAGHGYDVVDPGTDLDNDWWIKKFSSDGTELAEQTFDSNVNDSDDSVKDLVVSIEGGGSEYIYVAGYKESATSSQQQWHMIKYDSDLNLQWQLADSLDTEASAIDGLAVSANLVFAAGYQGGGVYYALRAYWQNNGSHNTTWDKIYNSQVFHSIAVDTNGFVYAAGNDITGGWDWSIHKFNSAAVEQGGNWPMSFTNTGTDILYSMALDGDNDLYVVGLGNNLAGNGDQDWWIKKVHPDGTEDTDNWDKKIDSGNGDDCAYGVTVAPDDAGVYVVGYGSYLLPGGGHDWWIKKFTSEGVEK